ncbi:uncharacterized protein LOC122049274 [Zingiber officinale]|uniref:Calmodulin-binding protein n=1 Tax=Zingiber officinale TaxID=94328 RepID=A0A8J5LVR1_ZINOF|nr:uncharacterized protein LOC122049274 [Zingiber officinale]KAG6524761.1 hypothetical protein ZIOFF_014700 [Zingiber officinale]
MIACRTRSRRPRRPAALPAAAMEHQNPSNGDEFESACSTPFASAPSSPGRGGSSAAAAGCFFSAPSSPMHYILSSPSPPYSAAVSPSDPASVDFSFDFEFSARFPCLSTAASADELFLNGQIRPMKLSSHLQRRQSLAPLPDLGVEEDECARDSREAEEKDVRRRDLMLRSRSVHRRARSLSPLRNLPFRWRPHGAADEERGGDGEKAPDRKQIESEEAPAPPVSASSRSSSSSSASSSSSSGRSSKRWIFLKDFLHRNKSEGSGHAKEKFWRAISFSAPKDSPRPTSPPEPETTPQPAESAARREQTTQPRRQQRPVNGLGARRRATAPSAHEWLYTANRAQAEEMKRRTFLPYRQGLLGCLWFSSKGYGAIDGFARSLNHVPSR